ncbi:XylR family transcriptional regulator [Lacunimicrobium album]
MSSVSASPLQIPTSAAVTATSEARPKVLLMVETSLEFGRAVLRGINKYLVTHRQWSVSFEPGDLIKTIPDWLDRWNGNGAIIRATSQDFVDLLRSKNIPFVNLGDFVNYDESTRIWSDQYAIGEMAATHLMERGYRNYACCSFTGHLWARQRTQRFAEYVTSRGSQCVSFESQWGTSRDHSWELQQTQIVNWLMRLPKPVGIFCCNDIRGLHVIDACQRAKISVPDEVAVIGVDNDTLVCDFCDPPLSSVILNAEQIGFDAAMQLEHMMSGQQSQQQELLIKPLGVATRQSTDTLAIEDPLVAASLKMIREQSCNGLTVEQVMEVVPISRSVMEKKFRRYLGRSPQQEIRHVQIKRIKELLRETDLTLQEIAEKTGFQHPEYLSVVFKRETDETPGAYRKRVTVS